MGRMLIDQKHFILKRHDPISIKNLSDDFVRGTIFNGEHFIVKNLQLYILFNNHLTIPMNDAGFRRIFSRRMDAGQYASFRNFSAFFRLLLLKPVLNSFLFRWLSLRVLSFCLLLLENLFSCLLLLE